VSQPPPPGVGQYGMQAPPPRGPPYHGYGGGQNDNGRGYPPNGGYNH
jgi:hypothetical protein